MLIDVPVLKVTGTVAMTVAMKNLVGIAPGMIYGWAKTQGYPPESGNPGLPHTVPVIDEMIVDLTALADVDFTVVDALTGMEKYRDLGTPVRMNAVLAGADIVAVDAVCAQIMGMNPDDIEYLTLGAFKGLGQSDLSAVKVNGSTVKSVARKFEKFPGFYGQGSRLWALKAGMNRLLARVEQTWGAFDFSLNICEDEEDDRYDGNRVAGLKFLIPERSEALMLEADERYRGIK